MAKPISKELIAAIVKNNDLRLAVQNKKKWPSPEMKVALHEAATNGEDIVRLGKITFKISYPQKQPYNDGEHHVWIQPVDHRQVPCGWFSIEKLAKDTMVTNA